MKKKRKTYQAQGEMIGNFRRRRGWTQEEVEWRTSITRTQIGRIERGECRPSDHTIELLEQVFELPPLTLVREYRKVSPETTGKKNVEPENMISRFESELTRRQLSEDELRIALDTALSVADSLKKSKD